MSTRSLIGIINSGNTRALSSVELIYCHFDGYPSHNGAILLDNYQTTKKVRQLMALGDISCLRSEIGEKHDFNDRDNNVVAYGRDHDESGTESTKFPTLSNLLSSTSLRETWASYIYLYDVKHSCWLWSPLFNNERLLRKLTPSDCVLVSG